MIRLRRLPHAMWMCGLVAVLSAWVWSATTPTFQVPDEFLHVGYVQYLSETGEIPRSLTAFGVREPSEEVRVAFEGVPFSLDGVPSWHPRRDRAVKSQLGEDLPRRREVGAGTAANNPPLYYLFDALPYLAARDANLFDRILAMRLFTALLAGLTTCLAFLFVRELLPGSPWTWTVGGLAVALHPMHGFMAGGVNPDPLLWAASAGTFLALARILRRGLTPRRGLGLGLALAAGLLTKAAMLAFLPAAAVALGVALWRRRRDDRRRSAVAGAGIAVATAALPYLGWLALRPAAPGPPPVMPRAPQADTSLNEGLSYVWQFFLPRLPFQDDLIPGFPLWETWFQGFVGRFGHFLFGFPDWANVLALVVAAAVLGLAGRTLWARRRELQAVAPEAAVYVLAAAATLAVVGIAGYEFTRREGLTFAQTRYLLPLFPLYAALVAVAARGAGRYGRHAGLALVALFAAQNLFAVLLTVRQYYS